MIFLASQLEDKLGAWTVLSRSHKSMTFSVDVGESTCKLLPLELGCAYVGSKGVALEGKSKGATRERTIKAT
jgi:hypothetical protein